MSTINPLSSNLVNLLSTEPISSTSLFNNNTGEAGDSINGSFADIFTEAFNTANVTDGLSKGTTISLLSGQSDDMAGILMAGQKAEIALNLAVTLRNKVLDAYTEVMRMQV